MPKFICKDCDYEGRDKWSLERHLNRKFGCNTICVGSKEKDENGNILKVVKINEITEEDIIPKQDVVKTEYKMKKNNNKLEKI